MVKYKDVIVRVECLWKRFGDVVANECVSVEAREGEVVSILGPNGLVRRHCLGRFMVS